MNADQLREAIESLERVSNRYKFTIRFLTGVVSETETIAASLRGILAIIESENAAGIDESMVRMHRDGAD